MRIRWWVPALAVAAGAAGVAILALAGQVPYAATGALVVPAHTPDEANGERLFWAGGCASCHAASGASGDNRLLLGGGMDLASPVGVFSVPNISPDPDTGIGAWSAEDFLRAMRHGVSPQGLPYYPSFPYGSYQRMPAEDVLDLWAFLQGLEPVRRQNGAHALSFPYNLRPGVMLWRAYFWDGAVFEADPGLSELAAEGAYLVEGPAHCGECHTPRTPLGGLDRSAWMAGAPNPDGSGFVPNITPHPSGIADWTADDIAFSLESGFTPSFDSFGGQMASVQRNMAELPARDRQAIAAYLTGLPALPTPASPE